MRDPHSSALDRGPLLGALLRFAHQCVLRRLLGRLSAAGFDDLQPAHFAPLQALWDTPDGARATDLAARARITKQSMGELIEQLVHRGFVERVPDPQDGRARLVRITARGRRAGRLARDTVRDVEADWSRRLGADRVEELRSTLKMLLESDSEVAQGRSAIPRSARTAGARRLDPVRGRAREGEFFTPGPR